MGRGFLVVLLALVLLVGGILVGCGTAKDTAEWHYDQGNKLAEQGRYDEAIEEYTKAIELDSSVAVAYTTGATPTTVRGNTTWPSPTATGPSSLTLTWL